MNPGQWERVKQIAADALEQPPEQRSAFLNDVCTGHPALRAEIESLLGFDSPGETLGSAKPVRRERIGPYRIERELGSGGMGVVYEAQRDDGQFQQRVAIKVIKRGMDSGAVLARFLRERSILARLEHPGITRLYDGGVTGDGLPYFVMELVEGVSVTEFARDKGIPEKVRLFLAICQAVAYAHQNLVLHRDLKASNILVTPQGTPKLLDFGIAKLLDPTETEDHTVASMRAFTPRTASPEQLRGEALTTASDTYSLGLLFYHTLTGVQAGPESPAVPSALSKAVSKDLDNIVLKAIRTDPAGRYPTAADFAADLDRFQRGLPVLARPQRWTYRAGRFLARNRWAAGFAAIGVLAVTASTFVAIDRGRKAARRFDEVRSLARSFVFEVHDAILPLPGSTAARELIVKRGLEYLDRLAADDSGDPRLGAELAEAYERLGRVQGYAGESNLGDRAGAIECFRKAARLFESLGRREDHARVVSHLISVLNSAGRHLEALPMAEEQVTALRKIRASDTTIAVALSDLANVEVDLQRFEDSLRHRREAAEILVRTAGDPSEAAQRRVALNEKRLGALLGFLRRFDEALPHYQRAREIDEGLLARNPNDRVARMDLSFDLSDIGWLKAQQSDFATAEANYRKVIALREAARDADPRDDRARVTLRNSYSRMAMLLARAGRRQESLEFLRHAVAMAEENRRRRPASDAALLEVADARLLAGDVYMAVKMHGAAPAYRQAKAIFLDVRSRRQLDASEAHDLERLDSKIAAAGQSQTR